MYLRVIWAYMLIAFQIYISGLLIAQNSALQFLQISFEENWLGQGEAEREPKGEHG